jgi:hypothetical protein
MSWLFSQALVEEYLGASCLDGEQSALSSGSHTQQAYCAPDKMTDFSKVSQSGMTFKPLMESLGEELLMSYLAGFHAKISLPQEKAQELMESGQECGNKWQELFAKYSQNMFMWKTPQCLLGEDSEQFLGTWPRWGSMRNGECFQQPKLGQSTEGKESGLWPTPTTPSGGGNCGGSGAYKNALKNGTHIPHSINPNLYEWLMGWPQGWTDLKPLETGKCLFAQHKHGTC